MSYLFIQYCICMFVYMCVHNSFFLEVESKSIISNSLINSYIIRHLLQIFTYLSTDANFFFLLVLPIFENVKICEWVSIVQLCSLIVFIDMWKDVVPLKACLHFINLKTKCIIVCFNDFCLPVCACGQLYRRVHLKKMYHLIFFFFWVNLDNIMSRRATD